MVGREVGFNVAARVGDETEPRGAKSFRQLSTQKKQKKASKRGRRYRPVHMPPNECTTFPCQGVSKESRGELYRRADKKSSTSPD